MNQDLFWTYISYTFQVSGILINFFKANLQPFVEISLLISSSPFEVYQHTGTLRFLKLYKWGCEIE